MNNRKQLTAYEHVIEYFKTEQSSSMALLHFTLFAYGLIMINAGLNTLSYVVVYVLGALTHFIVFEVVSYE